MQGNTVCLGIIMIIFPMPHSAWCVGNIGILGVKFCRRVGYCKLRRKIVGIQERMLDEKKTVSLGLSARNISEYLIEIRNILAR
ncbi:hypothetical protein PILCRDRAFT_234860 [Piloderma croceum F 1598]|uniref:Uncharacterized protein n=1 Tax=Piloderma croceum (strain F 1598) TaxID=765440 RepID=A0A0C3BQB3_PILCF|nr:hypothetical protein PILCRDRAFT_234860 [Piloderma croceum F 1598]